MFIEKKIANEIFDKYQEKSVDIIKEEDNFLKIIAEEYNSIIETARRQSMITNPEVLWETQKVVDVKELQKKITETLLLNLYTKNYISKGDYEALCQNCKQ